MSTPHITTLHEPFSGQDEVIGHLLMRGQQQVADFGTLKEAKTALIKDLKQRADACTAASGASESEALEHRRKEYGLTKGQFSEVLGLAAGNYGAVIAGRRRLPAASIGRAAAIGVPLQPMLAGRKTHEALPPTAPHKQEQRKRA